MNGDINFSAREIQLANPGRFADGLSRDRLSAFGPTLDHVEPLSTWRECEQQSNFAPGNATDLKAIDHKLNTIRDDQGLFRDMCCASMLLLLRTLLL
jgi:hypothetical protein